MTPDPATVDAKPPRQRVHRCFDCKARGVSLDLKYGHELCHECVWRREGFDQLELFDRPVGP